MSRTISANSGGIVLGTGNTGDNPLTVDAGVTVSGSYAIYAENNQAWTITNFGTLLSTGFSAVYFRGAGTLTNSGTASHITGGNYGINSRFDAITVTNQGTIADTSTNAAAAGIFLSDGGKVVNSGTASDIAGRSYGINVNNSPAAATISNAGTITGARRSGIYLRAGGMVTNLVAGARITGETYGVRSTAAASITNHGQISGAAGILVAFGPTNIVNAGVVLGTSGNAIALNDGGTITNLVAGSRITGTGAGSAAIAATGSAPLTVINHGIISGAVAFGAANGNLFESFPGAADGPVQGGTGTDTLELGSAVATGTIAGIGTKFTGFEQIEVDAGASWLATGANTLATGIGLAIAAGAELSTSGRLTAQSNFTVTGAGTLAATGGGRFEVGSAANALADQIKIDAGHTLASSGELLATTLVVGPAALLKGEGTVAASVSSQGTVEAAGGLLKVSGGLTGGTLLVDAHATLELDGAANKAAVVNDNGTLTLGAGATLDVSSSVNAASSGLFILGGKSVLELAKDTGGNQKIAFLGPTGSKLVIDNAALFGTNVGLATYHGPLLQEFGGAGDTIDLLNLAFTGAAIDSYNPATGLLQLHSGSVLATLHFGNASLAGSTFHIGNDGGHVKITHT